VKSKTLLPTERTHYIIDNHLVDGLPGRDLVGLKIRNTENVKGKVFGISLRDVFKPYVFWGVLAKVIQ
jgi:hypothetical protein